jgi:hypothetical protein
MYALIRLSELFVPSFMNGTVQHLHGAVFEQCELRVL